MRGSVRFVVAAITMGLWSARCSSVNQGTGSTLPDAGPVDAGPAQMPDPERAAVPLMRAPARAAVPLTRARARAVWRTRAPAQAAA